ncbi:MAG: ubiquinol-cytochrome c reductase iron-sulfur subunit [Gammaproteobacteria bacterium]|nr:ubiquinol-cytochrome c reductase iron-sulfur subunit [Gammaproteobacteria bacterium]
MNTTYSERRRFLGAATVLLASAGAVATSVPFIKSWRPSARARMAGAPVEAGIGKLEPGRMITVKWRGKPVWILRRTETTLQNLRDSRHLANLRDPDSSVDNQPDYARNEYRSLRPDVFVAIGICTHLGCVPTYLPGNDVGDDRAIYFCPCHGSKFDLAGRVFKNVPAPTNLVIPPHRYSDGDLLMIGEDHIG